MRLVVLNVTALGKVNVLCKSLAIGGEWSSIVVRMKFILGLLDKLMIGEQNPALSILKVKG